MRDECRKEGGEERGKDATDNDGNGQEVNGAAEQRRKSKSGSSQS